mmetsp:Transcript_11981/g.27834  ORF Transcript_11981/g.27834 Transcript_11981/m.27834 type:complete len:292 (-) Transcript_11981:777-1652(-)
MNPNENTGRWTQEEHERFLQGLELFGKKWTKVAEVVRTRTTVQVRSHAQKYFQKMVKGKHDGEPTAGTGAGVRKAGQAARGGLDIDNLRKQLPVPASLQPYLPAGGGDIATGLYRYLSPNEIPTGTPPVATTGSVPEDNRNSYPTWFQQAKTMDDLLVEAAQLDWTHDTGNRPGGAEDDDGHGGEDDDEEGGPRMQVERGSLEVPMPSPVDVSHMHSLPPAPAQAPALEPNFSSMEVDDTLFDTLINDEEFMAIAQDDEGNVTVSETMRRLQQSRMRGGHTGTHPIPAGAL